ncbi:unnamed protein product [Lathyrus sativus]|nr:unnamed protein product [Lathyrus sativus]
MSPFEALYGRTPPSPPLNHPGSVYLEMVDLSLQNRNDIINKLKLNLEHSRKLMQIQSNKKRSDISFSEGDPVLLRLQPYRQVTVQRRVSHKLSKRCYGPFKILRRIGKVAYHLDLPSTSRIHPVFHVSQLRKFYDMDPPSSFTPIPSEFENENKTRSPSDIPPQPTTKYDSGTLNETDNQDEEHARPDQETQTQAPHLTKVFSDVPITANTMKKTVIPQILP